MSLGVPEGAWSESLTFWSLATGWDLAPPRGERGRFRTLLPQDGLAWVELQAIDGGPHVHVDSGAVDREVDGRLVRTDPDRVLDQVCIDIPATRWDAEIAAWQQATGRELTKGGRPEFAFLGEDGAPRILLQRLDEEHGEVRAHPDFATRDREAETRRHEELGARLVEVFEPWTVMRAPDGHLYCLTDRDPLTGSGRR